MNGVALCPNHRGGWLAKKNAIDFSYSNCSILLKVPVQFYNLLPFAII